MENNGHEVVFTEQTTELVRPHAVPDGECEDETREKLCFQDASQDHSIRSVHKDVKEATAKKEVSKDKDSNVYCNLESSCT